MANPANVVPAAQIDVAPEMNDNNGLNCQRLPVEQYGGDPVNFVDFMRDYYMYAKAYGWPDKIMITRLPLYLKGAARDAYCQLKADDLATWAKCKDALAEKLVSGDMGRIMRKKFYNRVQTANETTNEFAFELNTLAEKAFGLREKWGEQIKNILQDQFLTGVHQHIRNTLSLVDYQDFDDLVKKAMRVEVNASIAPKTTTVNYTEMLKFQRPQSETSNNFDKSNLKSRTFNPPSPRNGRKSPNFDKNTNFQQMSPRRIVTCFRCQAKGHVANQCRTRLPNENNRDDRKNQITCNNCGRKGHIARDCYAPKSRSPSTSPSPQRNKLNSRGQQQCYACQRYGHIARSCPNNAERFQKTILKKAVKIDDNPVVNAAFSPDESFRGKFEAEMEEMKRKLDRFIIKSGSESDNDNLMLYPDDNNSERSPSGSEESRRITPAGDDIMIDKSRILWSRLRSCVKGLETNIEGVMMILTDLAKLKLPTEMLIKIMGICVSSIETNTVNSVELKALMSKFGREMRRNTWLEDIRVVIRINETTMLKNMSAYSTVQELMQLICESEKCGNVELEFAKQKLDTREMYLIDVGMIPGEENVVTVVRYEGKEVKLSEMPEDRLFRKLQDMLVSNDDVAVEAVLDEILEMPKERRRKCEFMKILMPYLYTVHKEKIKRIMMKFGSEFREENANFPPLLIKINMGNDEIEYCKLHWCSKVKAIRSRVYNRVNLNDIIVLNFNNQELDDDEYLFDCGVMPEQINEVYVSKVQRLVSRSFDELKVNGRVENPNAINENNSDIVNWRYRVVNGENRDGIKEEIKCEKEIKREEIIDGTDDNICRFRDKPEISFKVDPCTSFTRVQKCNDNRGLLRIVEQMAEKAINKNYTRELVECEEFLKGLLNEIYPLWRIDCCKSMYIRNIADQIVRIYPSVMLEINKNDDYDVIKMLTELYRDECTEDKVLVGLAFLTQQMGIHVAVNDDRVKSMIKEVAEIIWKFMYDFIRKQGGWKSLSTEKYVESRKPSISSRFGGVAPWLLTMIIMISLVSNGSSFTAYDCSRTELGKIYSLVDVTVCSEAYPLKLNTEENIPYYIYQESGFRRTTVRECIVKRTTFIFYCGKWSHSSLIEFKSIPRPVEITPENCEAAFQTNEIKISQEIKLTAKKNFIIRESFTIKGKLEKDGECQGEPHKIGNNIIDRVVIVEEYSTELRQFEGIFDDITGKMQTHPFCDMYSTSCHTGESMLVYRVKVKECKLIELKRVLFTEISGEQYKTKPDVSIVNKGKVNERRTSPVERTNTPMVLITTIKEEGMRFIRKETVIKCGREVYVTNYNGVYVSKIKVDDAQDKVHVSEIKMSQYFNNKIDFVFHSLTDTISSVYREIILNDCKLNREILRNRMAMVMTNPNIVAPMLIAENGVFARVLGEALYSYKCKEIAVQIMKYEHCTNELPVNVDGFLRFMEPITRVLLENGTQPKRLECNKLLAPLYKLASDHWISLPDRKQVKEPEKLEMTRLEYILNFTSLEKLASTGMYSNEDIEDARRNILFPSKRERVITEFVDKVLPSGSGNANYEYLYGPDHYKKATLNTMKKMWGYFMIFGQASSGFIMAYVVMIMIKVILTQVLSTYRLYTMFGLSVKLIVGCIPFLAKFLIISQQHNELKDIKSRVSEKGKRNKRSKKRQSNKKQVKFQSESDDSDTTVNGNTNSIDNTSTTNTENVIHSTQSLLPIEEWVKYKNQTIPGMMREDMSFQQLCSFKPVCSISPPCYPTSQLKEMRPLMDNRASESSEIERHNLMGLPSNYALMTIANFGKQPKITVQLNGVSIKAILDSGSSVTIISEEIIRPADLINMITTEERIHSMSRDVLNIIGLIKVELCIGGRTINHRVLVMRDSPVLCLIGMDVLEQLDGVVLDLKTGNLIYRPTGEIIHKAHEVFLNQDLTIPASHEVVYYANTINESTEEFLFEPNESFMEKHDLPMCNGLVTIFDRKVPVRFVNFADKPLKLKANTRIGQITPVQEIPVDDIPVQVKRYNKPVVNSKILTKQQNEIMSNLLDKYECVFAKHEYDLGRTHVIEHEIPLTDSTPIKQRAYKIPHAYQGEVKRQIDLMLKYNILRPSFSPWSSPIVPVKKKTGELRLCVDYRKLNSVTRKDTYPLPIPQEIYDKINKSTIISVIDLLSGYGQVGMAEKHKPLTACTDGRGLYEFNVLPFGLTGAPAIFQRTMNYILMDLDHALVYIDDIVVFSTSFEEHLKDLEMVFKRLKLANLKIKPSKCEWAKDSVVYVGHVISKNGIKPNPENVSKVQNFPIPSTIKQVRQFIGLAGYYRRFIQNFAQIAEPLNKLLRFENKFKWGIEQQQAFETLKQKLISEPILRHPDMSKPFLLMTDASNYAIGAVLGQKEDGEKDHVIAYASRQLNKHERNYSTIEKEALAIVFAVQTYRHYLIGKKIYLYTDHSPLQWLMTHRNTASRLIRWALSLQEFDIEIRYRKGKANANADALSRIHENNTDINDTVFAIIRQTTNLDEFRKQQRSDDEIKRLFREATIVKKNLEITQLIKNKQKYFIQDGILKCIIGENVVIVMPKHLRQAVMLQYHDGTLGGHLSARKTMSRIKMKYYWEAMESDIKNWCKTCEVCMTRKNTGAKIKVPLKPMPIPSAPMEITAMDVIGPLPETANGNKYILVFCDYLTKWPEAFALPDQKSETIAQIFVEHIVFRYGTPCKLLTDRGTNFTSDLFKAITELFQILKLTTSPYHPQTDGLVERFNGTLINMLASYTNRQQRDWDLFINSCLYAYRNSVHASTGETPFYLMYLRRNNMPIDLEFQTSTTQYMEVPDYKALMSERMQSAWKKAGLNVKYQQENYKSLYDKNAKPHGIKIGDLVYLNKPEPKKGLSPKLQRPFKGPYKVWGVTDTNLQLKPFKNKKAEPIIVHANRCKKISEVDEDRYPLRSKGKVKSDGPICFTINTKVRSKKLMLSTLLLIMCIGEVCGHQIKRLNNISDDEIIRKITIHRRYSILLWHFNGNARELCLVRNLNVTSGNIHRLNINNNKLIIRNLKLHTAYVFRIQYFVAEKDITTQIKTKIVNKQISTNEIKKLIKIEPLETEIHISWQPLQYLKVNIQFIENDTVIMDTMNHHKSFLRYKNLKPKGKYKIVVIYLEEDVYDNFTTIPQRWIQLLQREYVIQLVVEENKMIVEKYPQSIKVHRVCNEDEMVVVICTSKMERGIATLMFDQGEYEFKHLNPNDTYYLKVNYYKRMARHHPWLLYLVEIRQVQFDQLTESYTSIDMTTVQSTMQSHSFRQHSITKSSDLFNSMTSSFKVNIDYDYDYILQPLFTFLLTIILAMLLSAIIILCFNVLCNCEYNHDRVQPHRSDQRVEMTQV